MFGLGELLLACFLIYCAITRIVPQLLRWFIKRRYRIDARIGRIGIMTLRDVHLCAKGFTIEIDQIGFRSSFLSSEVRKLVSVVIHNIRIDKDDRSSSGNSTWRPPETVDDAKIPPIVITAAQFVSLRILKGTCALLGPSAVAHSTVTDVTVDASVVHSARSLIVSVTLDTISTQLLSPNFSKRSVTISASLDCGATLVATTPLTVQKVDLALKNIKSVVGDDLLTSFDWIKAKEKTKSPRGLKEYKAFVNALAPVLPKKLTFSLNSCVITDAANRDMASLNKLQINAAFNPVQKPICGINGIVDINFSIEQFNSKSLYEKFFELNNILCGVHMDDSGIYSKVKVRNLNFLYDESKMSWLTQLFNPPGQNAKDSLEDDFSLPDIHIQTKLEFWNVSSTLKCRDLSPAAVGFSHIKCDYDSFSEPIRGPFCDILAESVWCQLNKVWSVNSLRKEHTWGTALYLGLLIVKANKTDLRGTVDTLRIEWSPPFSELLVPLMKYVRSKGDRTKVQKTDVSRKFNLNLSFNDCNFFFIANKKVCLMMRVDKASVLSDRVSKMSFDANGLKLSSITPTSDSFACHRSTDVKCWCANVDGLRFESSLPEKLTIIQLNRNINCTWTPNIHLKIREMWVHFSTFIGLMRVEPVETEYVSIQKKTLQISVNGNTNLVIKPSQRHYFTLTGGDFNFSLSSTDCSWFTSKVNLSIDESDIFSVEAVQFNSVQNHSVLAMERKNNEDFVLPVNRGWVVTMKSAKAIFPYNHAFSSAVQDDLITVFKWLKRLHKRTSPVVSSPKLPPDLLVKVKEFVFEMSDDPFEVKLRDNYELLEDEYKENLKREKMLEEKISEICKSKAMVPAKMEDLYSALRVLSSDIYVKRSKMLNEQGTRTRLFAWIISDVRIIALCDPSIHGAENVINNMTQIDPDSPWPADGLEFSTLWCRSVAVNCEELKFLLRDFPQPWLFFKEIQMWGKVVGAEQVPTRRAKRSVTLELGDVWGDVEIERSMTSLKFYHDLNCEVERCSYAFGPCWEPVIAECNLSFEKIVRASLDPSPSLPLWDKLRLLLHGRVTMVSNQLTVLLHASRDPYNKTEEMEITWSSVVVDWTNAKVIFKGDLDIYVRTASKYDDCRLLHLPSLRLSVKLGWVCLGDPNDHHSVMPCAPDKLPDYSSNQEHDSFRAFRSQHLNISLSLETRSNDKENSTYPVALLYGSTLRWFENLKLILSGVTRPTRRGAVFKNVRPRKLPLSRHYKKVHLNLSLHTFQIHYWMSFAMQRGFELTGESIAFSSEHHLSLVPVNDGLKHRPRAEWSVVYMTCELGNAEIWLRSALFQDQPADNVPLRLPVEKCYFLSVGKVSYGREGTGLTSVGNPIHRLVVYGLKGAWTTSNRDVVLALFESFMKTKQLKKNLATEALKGFGDTNAPIKQHQHPELPPALQNATASNAMQATPSPMSKLQGSHAFTMLQQLIAEADTKAIVFSDEPTTEPNDPKLQGLAACQNADDVIYKNWLIALVNSQVLLKGPETKGYVIISAAKAEILQRVHRPVWKDRTVVTKTTWVGSLQSMQYYATVSAGENDSLDENIMWLSVDNIKEKDDCVIAELPDVPQLVGSGQSVGGVVSETVGASSVSENLQLQRIVSRCKCEFFYVCYGDSTMSPSNLANLSTGVPPPPPCDDTTSLWENHQSPVDAFTLMHHDLEVCTNSLQYGMLLDIVNNLLLYVEKTRKEAYERLQRMRFQLQLQSVEDQKRPIQEAQTRVRNLVSNLRKLEKEMYLVQRTLGDEPNSPHLQQQMDSLQKQMNTCKEALNVQSDELDAMLSCYKESQLMGQKMATLRGDNTVSVVRVSEICFKHAQWRLTENDGLLGIADLVLSNFLYTKNSKSDDSVEHLLELGYVRMSNLLPNQIYTDVLQPTELNTHMPMDRKKALRVFCREKAPVGGISVKEHFEINVAPLTIGLTKKFYNKMMKFCFPERDTEEGDLSEEGDSKRGKSYSKGKDTNFYVPIERKDDVEKMKERAEKNKLFIYIKIPEVPVKVSYKGNKEKNVEDMRDFSLVIPTLEYHNVTWTWLDLLLAMKSDSRRVILSQAIKQKLQIKIRSGNEEGTTPLEEDKARMLFGSRHMPGESKNVKKGIFKFQK